MLDVFTTDAFNMVSMTTAIDKLPFIPGRIGRLGLFKEVPITTTTAVIEERRGRVSLVRSKERGSWQGDTRSRDPRLEKTFKVPHYPLFDEILAEALQGVRAFGSEDQTEVWSQVVNDKLESMKQDHELSWEYGRVGAIKGQIVDGDGATVLYNLYTEFGISPTALEVNFYDAGDYSMPQPAMLMKDVGLQITRLLDEKLGGTPYKGVLALCGNDFFDALVGHATVRDAYSLYQEGDFLRNLQTGSQGGAQEKGFTYGGIQWENYRGSIAGTPFIPTDMCYAIPLGVPNFFEEYVAPADFIETVNTRGKRLYAKQELISYDKGVKLHTQSNVLPICTRPAAIVQVTGVNEAPAS